MLHYVSLTAAGRSCFAYWPSCSLTIRRALRCVTYTESSHFLLLHSLRTLQRNKDQSQEVSASMRKTWHSAGSWTTTLTDGTWLDSLKPWLQWSSYQTETSNAKSRNDHTLVYQRPTWYFAYTCATKAGTWGVGTDTNSMRYRVIKDMSVTSARLIGLISEGQRRDSLHIQMARRVQEDPASMLDT